MLIPCLFNSLRQGENAYVHCVSGISRAPVAAAVMSAVLMNISFNEARGIIDLVRNVKFDDRRGKQPSMIGDWIDKVLRERVVAAEGPTGFSAYR